MPAASIVRLQLPLGLKSPLLRLDVVEPYNLQRDPMTGLSDRFMGADAAFATLSFAKEPELPHNVLTRESAPV